MLDLVNPAAPCGRLLGRTGTTRLDGGSRVGATHAHAIWPLSSGYSAELSQDRFSSSGSLAMLAAMRRASSLVSRLNFNS